MSQHEVERLIEAYFDGTTTVADEQLLRRCLASDQYSGETIDEARFAMGMAQVAFAQRRPAIRRQWLAWTAVAATVALLVTAGIALLAPASNDRCEAWVNGEHITSQAGVESLINADLSTMAQASNSLDESMQQQLGSMGDALQLD